MAEIILPEELKPGRSVTFRIDGEEYHGHIAGGSTIVLLDTNHNAKTVEKIFNSFGFTRNEICSRFGRGAFGIWPTAPTYEDLYKLLREMKSRSSPITCQDNSYVEYTELSEYSHIKFHLPNDETYTGVISSLSENTYYVHILDSHFRKTVDKIFEAFKVSKKDINGIYHESDIWPESSLEDLQKFIKSLPTNSKKQTHYVFELQNTGINFKREENKRGNSVCGRIRKAAISIKCLGNSEISC